MPASRHELPDLPPEPVPMPSPVIRTPGGHTGVLPLCTARGRTRS